MDLTQEQIDALSQNLRKKHLRVELLDQNMVTIDSIEGLAISGSITANATNNIRRSGNITIAVPIDNSKSTLFDKLEGFTIEAGGKIWIDRNIKIYIGIENINSLANEIVWYKLGVFLIDKPTRSFSATNYTISFSCIDLMARLTGRRQGQLTGQSTLVEKGHFEIHNGKTEYVRTRLADVIIQTITELGGFSRFTIYPIPSQYEYLPYDIKVGVGSTIYSLLEELLNIIPTWEMFFDLDGIFVVRPIPSGENSLVYDLENTQYISNDLSVDFENVKNQIVVYGRINTLNYFTENIDANVNISLSKGSGISDVGVDIPLFASKVVGTGTFSFIYDGNNWNYDSQQVQLEDYGVTFVGEPTTDAGITILFQASDDSNVQYLDDGTLILHYSSINTDSIVISATTFGFLGLATTNVNPITRVQIFNGDSLLVDSQLVKFENSKSSFGHVYETTQIEPYSLQPKEIYFIRIYNATTIKNDNNVDVVDFSQDVIFEFVGKQSVSYCLVNTNIESPFYINKNIGGPNYYAGMARNDVLNNTSNYILQINNNNVVGSIDNGTIITFMANKHSIENQKVDIIDREGTYLLKNIPIVQNMWDTSAIPAVRNPIHTNKLYNDYTIWALKYEKNNDTEYFVLLGRARSAITKICSGGEYDNIYSDQLAYERCLYELFMASNMNDAISLGVVPNYLLDVNCKIKYKKNEALPTQLKEEVGEGETEYYIIKQITYPLGISSTPQNISAIRIYDSGNLVGISY